MSDLISGVNPNTEFYINSEPIPIPEPSEPSIIEPKNEAVPLKRLRITGSIITNE